MRSIEKIKQRSAEITKYNNRPEWIIRGLYKGDTVYKHVDTQTWYYRGVEYSRSEIIGYLAKDGAIDVDDPAQYERLLTFIGW